MVRTGCPITSRAKVLVLVAGIILVGVCTGAGSSEVLVQTTTTSPDPGKQTSPATPATDKVGVTSSPVTNASTTNTSSSSGEVDHQSRARAINFTTMSDDAGKASLADLDGNGHPEVTTLRAKPKTSGERRLDDVSMDDDDDNMESAGVMHMMNMSTTANSNLSTTSMPMSSSTVGITSSTTPSLGMCIDSDGKKYVEGQKFSKACDEICWCLSGKVTCSPRCSAPLFRRGAARSDPLCTEKDSDDPCCVLLICSHDTETEPLEGCNYKNETYTRGQTFNDGCESVCSCGDAGKVTCKPRCPPTATGMSDRCVAVPDSTDPCCSVVLCDVTLGDHEVGKPATGPEDHSAGRLQLSAAEALNATTVRLSVPMGGDVPANATVEASLDGRLWTRQDFRPEAHGALLSGLTSGKTYFVRLRIGADMGNALEVTLPAADTTASPSPSTPTSSPMNVSADGLCTYKGKTFSLDEEYHDGCSMFCACSATGMQCAPIDCPTDFGLDLLDPECLDWETLPRDFKPVPPHCCPERVTCRNNGSCEYKGLRFPNYSEIPIKVTGCEQRCYCEYGNVTCETVCPPVPATPPATLPCPPSQAQLQHQPGDDCCLFWVCPHLVPHFSNHPGDEGQATNSSTTTTSSSHPDLPFAPTPTPVPSNSKPSTQSNSGPVGVLAPPSPTNGSVPSSAPAPSVPFPGPFAPPTSDSPGPFIPTPVPDTSNKHHKGHTHYIGPFRIDEDSNEDDTSDSDYVPGPISPHPSKKPSGSSKTDNKLAGIPVKSQPLPSKRPGSDSHPVDYEDLSEINNGQEHFNQKVPYFPGIGAHTPSRRPDIPPGNLPVPPGHPGQPIYVNISPQDLARPDQKPLPGRGQPPPGYHEPQRPGSQEYQIIHINQDGVPVAVVPQHPQQRPTSPNRRPSPEELLFLHHQGRPGDRPLTPQEILHLQNQGVPISPGVGVGGGPGVPPGKRPLSEEELYYLHQQQVHQQVPPEIHEQIIAHIREQEAQQKRQKGQPVLIQPDEYLQVHVNKQGARPNNLPGPIPPHPHPLPGQGHGLENEEDLSTETSKHPALHQQLAQLLSNHSYAGFPDGVLPPGFQHPGVGRPQTSDEVTVQTLEPVDETTVRLVFSVPTVLVGLHGRVELRYTSDTQYGINQTKYVNNEPSTWEQQVLAPPGDLIATPQLEFELGQLHPDTVYKIKITVILRDLQNTPSSSVLTVRTLSRSAPATTLPPQIPVEPELTVTEVNATRARLSWRKATEFELQFIDGVQLRYKEIDGKVYAATPLIHRAVTSYMLDGLRPDTQYEVGIFFIPFPGQNTELQAERTVTFTTGIENDPYKFELTLDVHHIKSTSVELSWEGVPYPEDKFVNIFRAIYQSDAGKEDFSSFKIAKRDSPPKTVIQDLKPGTRYRLWLEAYLTNGRIKKSNVKDFITKPGSAPLTAGSTQQGKLEGTPLTEVSDFYGPMVAAAIIATLAILTSLALLLLLVKKYAQNKAAISTCRKSQSAYDNPSYKISDHGQARESSRQATTEDV